MENQDVETARLSAQFAESVERKSKMNKPDLDSDKGLMSYDAVRYCETFFQYCRHLQLYFDEKLTGKELCELTGLQYRLKTFVFDHAYDPSPVKEFVSRYRRLLSQMDRLL